MGGVTQSRAATPAGVAGDAVSDEILLARAFLSRVAEPCHVRTWDLVRRLGPVDAVAKIRATARDDPDDGPRARVDAADPHGDLEAAARRGIRLVVPESADWPHFAMSALERAGDESLLRLVRSPPAPKRTVNPLAGSPLPDDRTPPLALWVRGPGDLASLGVRSVGIVGARSATGYGTHVARALAGGVVDRRFEVVSGGAFGIDAAAHQGALTAGGQTVVVSAAGLDQAYPVANAKLFEDAARSGLVVSESPPGSAPQRRRFLTRNRLIAALSTGTVVVEAAIRSGATNTANHCNALGRPLMAVPGPVTSAMSAGCHALLAREAGRAQLVTGVDDVVALIGGSSDLASAAGSRGLPVPGDSCRTAIDALDEPARTVFDGIPAGRHVTVSEIVVAAGVGVSDVLRSLPGLERSGLIEQADGAFRAIPGSRRRAR